MKNKYFIPTLCIVLCCLGSCTKRDESPKSLLKISPDNEKLIFDCSGKAVKTDFFTILCDTDWEISSSQSWARADIMTGNGDKTVTVSVDSYTDEQERTATLTVRNHEQSVSIQVFQSGLTDVLVFLMDPVFRMYCREQFDTNKDGKLSRSEALSVLEINVHNSGITSLAGIGYFSNLEKLTCYNMLYFAENLNSISSLDLSQNKKLISLNCENLQLTSLDLKYNTLLQSLQCSYNELTELDMTHNSVLQSIICDENQLRSIDLSGCADLYMIQCHGNRLTSLDLSDKKNLLHVRAARNEITGLDLTGSDYIDELVCGGGKLQELDLRNKAKLRKLSCVDNQLSALNLTDCVMLYELSCAGNQLTSIALPHNDQLYYLNCSSNRLTTLDISGNPSLRIGGWDNNPLLHTVYVWNGFDSHAYFTKDEHTEYRVKQ